MTAKRKFTLIWLLIPLLFVRGLVPAGFMIDTSGGSLSIVMCGGNGPLAFSPVGEPIGHAVHHEQMDHSQHQGHQGHGGEHQGSGHQNHENSICPFAIAGSAAVVASIPSLSVDFEPARGVASADVLVFHGLSGPSRAQQSRAPPYFS
jgi:hypothetical protein